MDRPVAAAGSPEDREYLRTHNVHATIDALAKDIIEQKPEDVKAFVVDWLDRKEKEEEAGGGTPGLVCAEVGTADAAVVMSGPEAVEEPAPEGDAGALSEWQRQQEQALLKQKEQAGEAAAWADDGDAAELVTAQVDVAEAVVPMGDTEVVHETVPEGDTGKFAEWQRQQQALQQQQQIDGAASWADEDAAELVCAQPADAAQAEVAMEPATGAFVAEPPPPGGDALQEWQQKQAAMQQQQQAGAAAAQDWNDD